MAATSSGKPTALGCGLVIGGSVLGGWLLLMAIFLATSKPAPVHPAPRVEGPAVVMTDTTWSSGARAARTTGGDATLLWPAHSTELSSGFGHRLNPLTGEGQEHRGVDIPLPCGSEVVAVDEGTVTFAEWTEASGYTISVAHDGGWKTRYAHLAKLQVRAGQHVLAGELLGESGDTGSLSTGPHLHLEIWSGETPIDPMAFRYRRLASPSTLTAVNCGPKRDGKVSALGSID
jgi:murein DD-endopeptidase MepM/ murein hydrolase activator NlpD